MVKIGNLKDSKTPGLMIKIGNQEKNVKIQPQPEQLLNDKALFRF